MVISFTNATRILAFILGVGLPLLVPNLYGELLILLLILWLVSGPIIKSSFNILSVVVGLLSITVLVGITYSDDLTYAMRYVETYSGLVIFPLILFTAKPRVSNNLKFVLQGFVIGVIILNILSLFFISYDLWDPKNLQINLVEANNVIVKIHPAFLSMYISFCVFFLANQYFPLKNLERTKLGWVLFSLAVLLTFLIWLNSRAGILAFSLAALFFIWFKWRSKTRLIGLVTLLIFNVLIILLPFSRHRFLETPKMVLTGKVSPENLNDPSVYPLINRIQIFKCNVGLLKWPEIIYGYGTGDFRNELQKCFVANDYKKPLAENMDSHSEYFAQLHRSGVIGLGLFLILLFVPFRHALRYKSPLLGAFIILFAVIALFENVFSAQKGITFFALFCPLLWILAEQESATLAKGTKGRNHL